MKPISIRDVEGFALGHATDKQAGTGCTVILCESGAQAGVDVRGGAPATRETDLLRPDMLVDHVHAVALCGGSAFGLDAAGGVMEYLERRGVGFDTGMAHIPIVCAAALFDLGVGSSQVRPDKEMGLIACGQAGMPQASDELEGNVGAGTGCSVGKLRGIEHAAKAGIGISGIEIDGLEVAAVVACNAAGNIMNEDGTILAGSGAELARRVNSTQFLLEAHNAFAALKQSDTDYSSTKASSIENTTIGCIVTNASLTKAQAMKVASMAHDGLARAIIPAHCSNDGDTLFTMASGKRNANPDEVGIIAARVVEQAIRHCATQAQSAYDLPGLA